MCSLFICIICYRVRKYSGFGNTARRVWLQSCTCTLTCTLILALSDNCASASDVTCSLFYVVIFIDFLFCLNLSTFYNNSQVVKIKKETKCTLFTTTSAFRVSCSTTSGAAPEAVFPYCFNERSQHGILHSLLASTSTDYSERCQSNCKISIGHSFK